MKPNELRRGFLSFFEARGHTVVKSDLLIPRDDPTLLFTPAGMNQFKEMFLGVGNLPYTRAASCQKCMRMPDLENVGRTASHHTFFEMLGNFSFGDYFKREAIAWSLEYLVDTLGLDFERLHVSVYLEDEEAEAIWRDEMNVPPERIHRFGEKENFWPAEAPSKGPNGVCGPCSEVYVDLGGGCGRPGCDPACECGRFVEVWNLVFTEFNRKDGGVLEPLPFKNIDTGMGFERLLRILEGVPTNFDTSLFRPLVERICERCGRTYGERPLDDVRIRRIADHVRAAVFCICDGARPSNEKQGYVVRKVLRRAIMDGRNLGVSDPFLHELVPVVRDLMEDGYPELRDEEARITGEIRLEEEKFSETYTQGSARLSLFMDEMEAGGEKVLSGKKAFLLYDTFGFPLDLARRTLEERGYSVDVEGFNAEMEAQRARARKGSKISDAVFDTGPLGAVKGKTPPTRFLGYERLQARCRVLHILTEEGLVDSAGEGTRASLVLDETPFYAEAGGQVGDRGVIRSPSFAFTVDRGTACEGPFYLHHGLVTEGTVSCGDAAEASVDRERRVSTARNHTATHLLHHALRRVLGEHVAQAGSLVAPDRLRFDFLHGKALTSAQVARIQEGVNAMIRADLPVKVEIMSLDAARAEGAIALFGEKYGEEVRVVTVEGGAPEETSRELCGGTHVGRTGEIGAFRILSEESVAAGVRRIEAATGAALEALLDRKLRILRAACEHLRCREEDLVESIGRLQETLKEQRKEIRRYRAAGMETRIREIIGGGRVVTGVGTLYGGRLDGLPVEELRGAADRIRKQTDTPVGLVLLSVEGDRVHIVTAFDAPFQRRGVHAGRVCKALGQALGGGGGGRPGMAQGQGREVEKAPAVLARTLDDLEQSLSDSGRDPAR